MSPLLGAIAAPLAAVDGCCVGVGCDGPALADLAALVVADGDGNGARGGALENVGDHDAEHVDEAVGDGDFDTCAVCCCGEVGRRDAVLAMDAVGVGVNVLVNDACPLGVTVPVGDSDAVLDAGGVHVGVSVLVRLGLALALMACT